MKIILSVGAFLLAASAPGQSPASRPAEYEQRKDAPAGRVEIRVLFRGDAPASRPIVVAEGFRRRSPEDAAFCDGCAKEGSFYDESLLVDPKTKGVRNVAVAFKKASAGRRPPLPLLEIDNNGARFGPRVSFAPVGEPISVKNSDPIGHALALSSLDEGLLCNVVVAPKSTVKTPRLMAGGLYIATCPLHDWMRATVVAVKHPYAAVTDALGTAVFDDAPVGPAQLVIFHETFGTATRTITVAPEGVVRVDLTDGDFRPIR